MLAPGCPSLQATPPSIHCFSWGREPPPDIMASALVLSQVKERGHHWLEPS